MLLRARRPLAASLRLPLLPLRRHLNIDLSIGLNEDQKQIQTMAQDFANEELAPFAAQWDKEKFFPQDVLRRAAALGFGGVYVPAERGGAGLGRKDAAVVFEALVSSV